MRKTTTTREYDEQGKLVKEIITVEEDEYFTPNPIIPDPYPTYPWQFPNWTSTTYTLTTNTGDEDA